MDWGYIFKHWIGTLLLAPIFAQIIKDTGIIHRDKTIGLFEMFPEAFQVGMMLSLPTLLLYLFVYHIAAESTLKTIWVKLIVILWTTIGISLTLYLLDAGLILPLGSYYIIASVICGLLLKIKRMPKEMVDSDNRNL
ncbi:hypothetical protein [Sphingobacterium yanglingense]|uniref:Uncharacterized protein n=1 Tax=Sphingobacterium yanglingense TaxID=1437280 RepID=A0A4R6WL71_9SPHI|nr:hypothetical protein [Sphingobacterium yanglingense]TDQ79055.1 hypothetical protein CLV99_0486 [Sphingobacterium yanglingense]